MQIVPTTFLALAAVLLILYRGPWRGLWVFLCLAPMGAAAAFNLPAVGGASIGMKEVGVLALIVGTLSRPGAVGQLLGTMRVGQPGFPLLLFMIYSAISAFFLPIVFMGQTELFSLSRDATSNGKVVLIPLGPNSGNITQLFSLMLGFLAYLCLASAFRARPESGTVVFALACTTVFHVALGVADVASFATGTQAAMDWLRTANYAMLIDGSMFGLKRMVGGFPEASAFGAFSLGLFSFWLMFWARVPSSRSALAMLLISLAVLLRATSSGAYVGLVGFLMIFSAMQVTEVVRIRATRQSIALTVSLVALLWLSAVSLVAAYHLFEGFHDFINRILLDKLQSSSGVERSSWNSQALQNFWDTWMIGAGLGSTRASNLLVAALSNVGLPGTLIYVWFLISVFRVPVAKADPYSGAVIKGLKAAVLGLMLTDLLTGTTPNEGVFFFSLAGLAAGLSRASQLRGDTDHARRLRQPDGSRGKPFVAQSLLGGIVLLSALAIAAPGARAETLTAPGFAASSNFGQGLDGGKVIAAWRLGLRDLRDAVYWAKAETADGSYVYKGAYNSFPRQLARAKIRVSLTVNNPHPAYDGGKTPVTPAGVAAFARFAAHAAQRFEAVNAVEVGNEMNSVGFASGPGWPDGDLRTRAKSYTALLAQTARMVRAARPDIRILGGAAMAVPLAWIKALSDENAAAYMDALVLHPYTTPPEHLRRQFAAVRSFAGFENMPVEVTEFGQADAAGAPDYMLRGYCQMALSGVTRVVWYPLTARGDGMTPLLDATGQPTKTGEAARFILQNIAGTTVADIAPDPFTYGCSFGGRFLVLWGAARDVVSVADDVRVLTADGQAMPRGRLALSPTQPLIFVADRPLRTGLDVVLAPQRVVADSFDQFGAGPFSWFVRADGAVFPMIQLPGQERGGVPWTPYLGSLLDGRIMVSGAQAVPVVGKAIALRYTVAAKGKARIILQAMPSDRSKDGISLTVTLRGRAVALAPAGDGQFQTAALQLRPGDVIEADLGAGTDDSGDLTRFRMTVISDPG